MEVMEHDCEKVAIIEELTEENQALVCSVRDARNVNMRMQVLLIELLSGKKINIDLPDKLNPMSLEIDCQEENGIFIYGGCLRIPNDVNKLFESLCDPESDHYFPTKILEGYTTKTAVKAVESEAVYFVAEEMFKNRCSLSGLACDIPKRIKIFDDVIYKKIDYMFRPKSKPNRSCDHTENTQQQKIEHQKTLDEKKTT